VLPPFTLWPAGNASILMILLDSSCQAGASAASCWQQCAGMPDSVLMQLGTACVPAGMFSVDNIAVKGLRYWKRQHAKQVLLWHSVLQQQPQFRVNCSLDRMRVNIAHTPIPHMYIYMHVCTHQGSPTILTRCPLKSTRLPPNNW
jgi:hypothetical protein